MSGAALFTGAGLCLLRFLGGLLFLGPLPLAAQEFRFANLSWGSSPSDVRIALERERFTPVAGGGPDLRFDGTLYSWPARIHAMFQDGALLALEIDLQVTDCPAALRLSECALNVYTGVWDLLAQRYGPPHGFDVRPRDVADGTRIFGEARYGQTPHWGIRGTHEVRAGALRETNRCLGSAAECISVLNFTRTIKIVYQSPLAYQERLRRERAADSGPRGPF